ncbi:hypothetical protein [Pseudorhodoferax aquiterrae]|uniref:hypothetical protein n=1 Tax=Pseudorhodoferax aquiterrae TaxID=747304 RepID=UPI00167294CE|nr:hypothetical protein [Pseudorhodoferax aquiterrae]
MPGEEVLHEDLVRRTRSPHLVGDRGDHPSSSLSGSPAYARGRATLAQGSAPFEFIETDKLLLVLLRDVQQFGTAVLELRERLGNVRGSVPRRRRSGVIVTPMDVVMSSRTSAVRLRELAKARIVVRRSPSQDLREGALQIRKMVMEQYEIAAQHGQKARNLQPSPPRAFTP